MNVYLQYNGLFLFSLSTFKPVKLKPNSLFIYVETALKRRLEAEGISEISKNHTLHTRKKMMLKKEEEMNTFILLITGRNHLNFLILLVST